MLCIDPKNAMYVTPKELHGPRLPVHVIKSVLSGKICYESEICRDMARIAARSGNPASECILKDLHQHNAMFLQPL